MGSSTSTSGKSSTGFDQNLAAALTYLGGAVTGIVFLVVERENRFVRFHALQSTITFLGVLVLQVLIRSAPLLGGVVYWVFIAAVVVLWLVLMVKALSGERYKLPYIGDWAERELR
jgi:uncharacterized membrane protein